MTMRPRIAAILLLAVAAGCSDPPRAPDLTTEAVYQNDRAGLRFLTPDGWRVYAKAIEPDEPWERPLRLIAYQHVEGTKRADLDLYSFRPPEGGDIVKFLEKYPIGPDIWKQKSPSEDLVFGGVAAKRYHLTGSRSRAEMRRELTAFPRGDRVYLFVLTTEANDTRHREQAHMVIEKVVWK